MLARFASLFLYAFQALSEAVQGPVPRAAPEKVLRLPSRLHRRLSYKCRRPVLARPPHETALRVLQHTGFLRLKPGPLRIRLPRARASPLRIVLL